MKNKLLCLFLVFFTRSCAYADSVKLYMENDAVIHTDRHYTHGTRISYFNDYTNEVPLLLGETKELEFAITQLMYTPNGKTNSELLEDERPYAGFLGAGITARSIKNDNIMTEEGITLGTVGPNSFAEETQKEIHRLTDSKMPQGWDNQINNEPILNVHYQIKYKAVRTSYFDIIPKNDNALGNMFIYSSLGAMTRFGFVPNDFGVERIEPTLRASNKQYYLYGFVDGSGRYVVRNIFLDGNTFEDSHSVDKESVVGDLSFGVATEIGCFGLSYCYIIRSKEFKEQDEYNKFGSVSLTYRW